MTGFTKLYSSILDSSVWDEDVYTRILWITMLAAADQYGRVICSRSRLRAKANIPQKPFDQSLRKLSAPDPESRTPDNEGRRIEQVQGGWVLLNYETYRKLRTAEERKLYKREWDRQNRPSGAVRAKVRQKENSPTNPTEAEAEGNEEEEGEEDKTSVSKGARALDLSSSVRFAQDLENLIPPQSQSDRTALLHLTQYLMVDIKEGRRHPDVFEEVLLIARVAKTARKPIAVLFSKLRQEIGYNAKAEAEKRK